MDNKININIENIFNIFNKDDYFYVKETNLRKFTGNIDYKIDQEIYDLINDNYVKPIILEPINDDEELNKIKKRTEELKNEINHIIQLDIINDIKKKIKELELFNIDLENMKKILKKFINNNSLISQL